MSQTINTIMAMISKTKNADMIVLAFITDEKDPPRCSQTLGMWSRNSSGLSASRRLCGWCPDFAPPGREFSRFSFLSVEGGLDEVR
jgi:hypothetical protein